MANVTGSFTATGSSSAFTPRKSQGSSEFNITIWGTFVGTVLLERSFDGSTWHPLTAAGSSIMSFTAPCSETWSEVEDRVQYRLRCSAYTSGTISYRLSQ